MANVVRANREFDQRAVFGLGDENQAEDLFDQDDSTTFDGPVGIGEDIVDAQLESQAGYPPYGYGFDDPDVASTNTASELFVYQTNAAQGALFDQADGTVDESYALHVRQDYTRTEAFEGSYTRGLNVALFAENNVRNTADDAGNGFHYGVYSIVEDYSEADVNAMVGFDGTVFTRSAHSHDVFSMTGVNGFVGLGITAGTTAVGDVIGVSGTFSKFDASSTVTRAIGLYSNQGSTQVANVTEAYGVFVTANWASIGSTKSRGIFVDGPTQISEFEGRLVFGTANSAIADADLANSEGSFYLNEAGNTAVIKVKYANGTVKTGTIALT